MQAASAPARLVVGATCLLVFVAKAMLHLKPAEVEEEEALSIPDAEVAIPQAAS